MCHLMSYVNCCIVPFRVTGGLVPISVISRSSRDTPGQFPTPLLGTHHSLTSRDNFKSPFRDSILSLHVFGLWEENRVHRKSSCRNRENLHTLPRKTPSWNSNQPVMMTVLPMLSIRTISLIMQVTIQV